MRVETLALIALLLTGTVAAVVFVGLDRLGYLEEPEAMEWEFVNRLLEVPYGTRVVLRSANPKAGRERLWFGPRMNDPEIPELPPKPEDMPPLPHVRMGRETQVDEETTWFWVGNTYALYSQLGARTIKEWLLEIRPVREIAADGSSKLMLRAAYGNQSGAKTLYFFDPNHADPASLGFGWVRMEAYAKENAEVVFAFPAGRFVPK